MANFLLIYSGGSEPQGDAEGQAVMKAWTDWFTKLGGDVVDSGNPIAPGAKSIASNGRVSDSPVGTPATGYSIIKADSLDAAVNRAKTCPHLASGGQISVYETFNVM
jgi:hypothetical protein